MRHSKNWTYFFKIALVIGVIAILRVFLAVVVPKGGMTAESTALVSSTVREFFPEAVFIEKDEMFTSRMRVLGPGRGFLGYLILTSPFADHIVGYAGPTPVLMAKTGDGIILDARMLENSETPGFNAKVKSSGLLESLQGLHWRKVSQKEVDAVTGATFTSKAVIRSVRHTLTALEYASKTKKTGEDPSEKISSESRLGGIVRSISRVSFGGLLAIIIASAAFFTAVTEFSGKQRVRTFILLMSLIWLGFARAELISIDLIVNWVVRGVFTGASAGLLIIAVATILVSATKGKALYCYYICPFGAMQEFAGKIFPAKIKISRNLFVVLSKIRYAFLLAIPAALFIFPSAYFSKVEPFTAFAFTTAGGLVFFIAGFSLFFSLFVPRFWCVFLCPTGAFFEIFRRSSSGKSPGKKY
jgi:hypothetical protein